MNTRPLHINRLAATLCAAGLLLAAGAAHAAGATGRGSVQSQYQQDVAACKSGATGQDQAACLREAGAARQEASRNNLKDGSADQLQQNMLDRCNRLPADSRQDCVTQMTSPTNVRGSVQGGGVLRETVIQVPADSVAPAAGAPGMAPGAAPMTAPVRQ